MWDPESAVHSVLLYGAPGSGKRTVSQLLTAAWLCKSPTEAGACGECAPCKSFAADQNADVMVYVPSGASEIFRLDAIRPRKHSSKEDHPWPIERFSVTPPLQSRMKVAVLHSVHRMTKEASNALLKMLEEPPPHFKFLLTTHELGFVAPTIISRCLAVAADFESEETGGLSLGQKSFRIRHEGALNEIARMVALVEQTNGRAALRAAESLRELGPKIAEVEGWPARLGHAMVLELIAEEWRERGYLRECGQSIEAHRRVLQNGQMALALDALFAGFCSERE